MNYYQVLDIPPDASPEDIKRAYRRLARKHHPDVAGVESGDRFHQVQAAYEILSDPGERRKYDLSVGWGRSPRTAIPYRPVRAQAATVSQPAAAKPTNYKPPKQTVRHSPPQPPPSTPSRPPAADRPNRAAQSANSKPNPSTRYAAPQGGGGSGSRDRQQSSSSNGNSNSANGRPHPNPKAGAASSDSPKRSQPFTPPPRTQPQVLNFNQGVRSLKEALRDNRFSVATEIADRLAAYYPNRPPAMQLFVKAYHLRGNEMLYYKRYELAEIYLYEALKTAHAHYPELVSAIQSDLDRLDANRRELDLP